jgi:putative transposase
MGVNADGRRELLGLKVGDSETEAFWAEFIASPQGARPHGRRLVVSDAHVGLTKAIRRQLQGCVWQRCRVHFARNLLQRVPRAHQGMVTAALRSVFAQESADEILSRWDDLAASLAERFPRAAELMNEAREDVLAFRHFPKPHWRKIWSTNLLERVNEEIKRRTRVVGIFPNDAAITRLVGAVLLEQHEHWQLEGRRMFSAESMAAIPELEASLPCRPPAPERAGRRPQVIEAAAPPQGAAALDRRPGAGRCHPRRCTDQLLLDNTSAS